MAIGELAFSFAVRDADIRFNLVLAGLFVLLPLLILLQQEQTTESILL